MVPIMMESMPVAAPFMTTTTDIGTGMIMTMTVGIDTGIVTSAFMKNIDDTDTRIVMRINTDEETILNLRHQNGVFGLKETR